MGEGHTRNTYMPDLLKRAKQPFPAYGVRTKEDPGSSEIGHIAQDLGRQSEQPSLCVHFSGLYVAALHNSCRELRSCD